jgi:DtxR family Mn-dependent transcriptional regulator
MQSKMMNEPIVLSQSAEDYLKTIYTLESKERGASTTHISNAMDVSSASATNMIKRLSEMRLVEYESYKGARLTNAGRKVALEVIRHHRLLELYLMEVMGYSWDEVHDEAENLEHHISEQFEEKIVGMLNDPTHDPHGDPIPTKEGRMPAMEEQPLIEAREQHSYLIVRVNNQDPEPLRYLEKEGLMPGVQLTIKEKTPLNDTITVLIGDHEKILGPKLGRAILVSALPQ